MRREQAPRRLVLSWKDVDALIDRLLPQMIGVFDSLLMVTRGGIVPGGLLAEALGIKHILVASVEFPADASPQLLAWPTFAQFPEEELVRGRRMLVVDDVWTHGRHIMTVRGRLQAYGARPELCVLHYKPGQSLFPNQRPQYFGDVTEDYVLYPWEVDRRASNTRVFTSNI